MDEKEMLKVASLNVVTKTVTFQRSDKNRGSHALQFVKHFNITAGDLPVPTLNFYYLYTKWQKHNRVTRHQFTADLKQLFKIQKKGKYRYFYVSSFPSELIDISRRGQILRSESAFRARQHDKKRRKKEKELQKAQKSGTNSEG